jgi:hypothetical protein
MKSNVGFVLDFIEPTLDLYEIWIDPTQTNIHLCLYFRQSNATQSSFQL